jgi:FeS assembly SUF system protein
MLSKQDVLDKLSTINDPEIAMNIVDLGLIYDLEIDEANNLVKIKMTLTTPACPLLEQLLSEIETKVKEISGITRVIIDIVWEPPWSPEMMSDNAKIALGMV